MLQPAIAELVAPIRRPPRNELTACLLMGRLNRNLPVPSAERKAPMAKGMDINPTSPRG